MNLLNDNKESILAQQGIIIKIASGNYHREVGLSEHALHNVKPLLINSFREKVISSIFNFEHMCGLIEFYLNKLVVFSMFYN